MQNEQFVCLYMSETMSASISMSGKKWAACNRELPLSLVASCVMSPGQEHFLLKLLIDTNSHTSVSPGNHNSCKLWLLPCMFNLFLAMFVYWILHWIPPRTLVTPRTDPFLMTNFHFWFKFASALLSLTPFYLPPLSESSLDFLICRLTDGFICSMLHWDPSVYLDSGAS